MSEKLDSAGLRGARERGDAKVASVLGIKSPPRPETVEMPAKATCPHCGGPDGYLIEEHYGIERGEAWVTCDCRLRRSTSPTAAETGAGLHDTNRRLRSCPSVAATFEMMDELASLRAKLAHYEDQNYERTIKRLWDVLGNPPYEPGGPDIVERVASLRAQVAELTAERKLNGLLCDSALDQRDIERSTIAAQAKRIAEWNSNVEAMLKDCPFAVRMCEGNGPENLVGSLAITWVKAMRRIAELEAQVKAADAAAGFMLSGLLADMAQPEGGA